MARGPARSVVIFVTLVVLGALGTFLSVVEISFLGVRQSETKVLLPDYNTANGRAVLHLEEANVKSKLAYTEKGQPLVRIYDYLPRRASEAERSHIFEQAQKWLRDRPKDDRGIKPVCKNVTKKILWFDVWHKGTGVRNKARKVDFSKCQCRCELDFFVYKESEANKTYVPFGGDAVLFQLNKMVTMDHPPLKREGQVFVAVEREATPKSKIPLRNFEYTFNWTMTFRQDSDIFYPYGRIVNRTKPPEKIDYSQIFRQKKKGIVWFVSHCHTKSKREVYAEELSKYIDLDIVGNCGDLRCPKHGPGTAECLPKYESNYFFRFNFENTYHTDYVTEKLFENFPKDLIQIVGGSAEYDNIVPENTIIDAKDFDSPKTLATYLKILMNNEERYTSYLKTKSNYDSENLHDQSQRAYCKLCSMLHEPERHRNLYYNVGDWFLS